MLSAPATVDRGLAGLIGQVYGQTTPSLTKVEVIGEPTEDYAVNVFFKEKGEALWLSEELLELVDHAPGTEIQLKGVPKKWVRAADGQWIEELTKDQAAPRPWWRFW